MLETPATLHRGVETIEDDGAIRLQASIKLLLPDPLLPMRAVRGVRFTGPLRRTALKFSMATDRRRMGRSSDKSRPGSGRQCDLSWRRRGYAGKSSTGRPRAGRSPIRAVRIGPGDRPPDQGGPPVGPATHQTGGAVVKKWQGQPVADDAHAFSLFLIVDKPLCLRLFPPDKRYVPSYSHTQTCDVRHESGRKVGQGPGIWWITWRIKIPRYLCNPS